MQDGNGINRAPRGAFTKADTGRRIDTWLLRNGMSTREASMKTGIPYTSMRYYRIGKARPSQAAMIKLEAIGLTSRYVYGGWAEKLDKDRMTDDKYCELYRTLPDEARKKVRDLIDRLV